jgi:hypothetical protein
MDQRHDTYSVSDDFEVQCIAKSGYLYSPVLREPDWEPKRVNRRHPHRLFGFIN